MGKHNRQMKISTNEENEGKTNRQWIDKMHSLSNVISSKKERENTLVQVVLELYSGWYVFSLTCLHPLFWTLK